ncbi:MAG: hypothetical protein ABJF65_00270 [Reichenbachiella sp.]|uniref:hypothetical protein n=1 Tax=Reichenbachiella sp. TaxID=2184521 RepID=UPI003266C20F
MDSETKERLNNFKSSFDLESFLINTEGYTHNPKDSVKGHSGNAPKIDNYVYKILKRTHNGHDKDIIEISKGPTGHWVYKNLGNDFDKGSIIDYLMINQKMKWPAVFKFMENSGTDFTTSLKRTEILPPVEITSEPSVKIISTHDFKPNEYFQERGIEETITRHPFIFNAMNWVRFKMKNKPKPLFGNAFSLRNAEGEIKSYNMKSDFFHKGMFVLPRENSFWYAKPEKIDQVFIGEAAVDVISFYKLYPKPNTLLISSEGRLSTNYIREAIKLCPNLNSIRIHLINDNDIYGLHYDLKWISELNSLPIQFGVKKVTSVEQAHITYHTADEELTKLLEPDPDHLDFDQALNVGKKLIRHYAFNIKINKSRCNDWNNDLNSDVT